MATDSSNDNGCPGSENDDGDNYFCLPKTSGASTDLSEVFKKQEELDQETASLIARLRVSPEGQEGLSAFLEKRKPDWSNPGGSDG